MDVIAQAVSKAGIDVPVYAHEVEGSKVRLHLPWSTVEVDLAGPEIEPEPEPEPPRESTPQPTLAPIQTRSTAKKIAR
jgi:hypothetical protein